MSKSSGKMSNGVGRHRLMFEHVDRLGRVSLLPLSKETQKLFAAAELGSRDAQRGIAAADGVSRQDLRKAAQSLTVRQWQVFDLLIAGLSSKQIAHELSISPRTVEIHRAKVMEKMGARSVAHLVKLQLSVSDES